MGTHKKTKMKLSSAVLLATAECGPMMGMKPVMMPGMIMPEPVVQTATQDCSSWGFAYAECDIDDSFTDIEVATKYSNSACVEGESFGIRDGKIWVDKGCRARFQIKKTVGVIWIMVWVTLSQKLSQKSRLLFLASGQ